MNTIEAHVLEKQLLQFTIFSTVVSKVAIDIKEGTVCIVLERERERGRQRQKKGKEVEGEKREQILLPATAVEMVRLNVLAS